MQPWTAPPVPSLPGAGGPVRLRASPAGDLVVAAPGPTARMYVCGITPYDATHLGHAATYLAFDLLHRAWLDAGQEVLYAQNVTDVDDPLLERATATGVDWRELAASQIDLFAQDMAALRVLPPHAFEGAVEAIGRIVPAVEELLGRGAAYRVGEVDGAGEGADDVYFDLGADPRFGEVARLDRPSALALSAERGGDPQRRGKRDPLDPLLWRGQRPGEPSWDGASLGPGRPGWHIECAVIAHEHLGTAFDVQGGGSDLLFPHHEMSASHGHVLHGWPFARSYAHAGMVGLDGVKMSKSLGNLVLVSRLRADGVDPMAVRLAVLGHRWRSDWSWTDAGLADAQRRLATWRRAVAHSLAGDGDGDGGRAVLAAVRAALADDLDAPAALAEVDAWAGAALAGDPAASGGALVRDLVDALLGVRL